MQVGSGQGSLSVPSCSSARPPPHRPCPGLCKSRSRRPEFALKIASEHQAQRTVPCNLPLLPLSPMPPSGGRHQLWAPRACFVSAPGDLWEEGLRAPTWRVPEALLWMLSVGRWRPCTIHEAGPRLGRHFVEVLGWGLGPGAAAFLRPPDTHQGGHSGKGGSADPALGLVS